MSLWERVARFSTISGTISQIVIVLSLFSPSVSTRSGPGAGEASGWETLFSSLFPAHQWGNCLLPAVVCPFLLYGGSWWVLVTQKKGWAEGLAGGILLFTIPLTFLGGALSVLIYLASFLSDYETIFYPAFWIAALAFLTSFCCSLVLAISLIQISSAWTDQWIQAKQEQMDTREGDD